MPSALEKLVKILKLEREQGYKNTAVIGGLRAFSEKWVPEAHTQARKPEHHQLVDELGTLLFNYESLPEKGERLSSISYMLDRITGRAQPSASAQTTAPPAAASPPQERKPPPEPRSRQQGGREQERRSQTRASEPQKPAERPREEPRPARPSQPPRRDNRPPQPGANARPGRGPERGGSQKPQRRPRSDDAISAVEFDKGQDFTSLDAEFEVNYRSDKPSRPLQPDVAPQPRLARPPRKSRPALSTDEAVDIIRGLYAPVSTIRGVGPKMAETLGEVGINTINDMLFYLPRRYDDYTRLTTINKLQPNATVTVIGTVRSTTVLVSKNGRKDFSMVVDDGTAYLNAVFFGQHFLVRAIRTGMQVVLSGQTGFFNGKIQMTSPEWESLDGENLHTTGIVPVYPLTESLRPRALRKLMHEVVEYWAERIPDYIPQSVLDRTELADLGWTIKNLHFPEGWDHLAHAKNRLIFDELLLLQTAILSNRRAWQSVSAPPLTVTDDFLEFFLPAVFPYELTGAQRRAIEDIRRDVSTSRPMNRLVQGDVGSGKTVVATTAMAMAFANGKQSALMAPTGILAEQHYRNLSRVLANTPGERQPVVRLLTGSLSPEERDAVYAGLADGTVDMVIGTHAIIQQGVEFNDLAVAIIDEQHRFGVEQRKALRGKGTNPHLLVMTATPIPRTLSLTLYADLDLSIMDEMPPGRTPVQTRLLEPVARERVFDFIKSQIGQGRQAFVVHPLVDASEKVEARSALEAYEELKHIFFRHRLGLLHGRMKSAEKDEAMRAFTAGEFDILVTTSVAEVGVDVPNASVIVIENADRFGLAQLHQFRGRVGRGEHPSYCLLISTADTEESQDRLRAMEATTDGFQLAEIDWKMRGPGDLLGTSQSGQSLSKLTQNEMTPHLVDLAQREARTLYEEDLDLSQPEHRLLAQRVNMLHNERSDVS